MNYATVCSGVEAMSLAVNCARFVMMRIQQSEDKYSKKDTL